MSMSNDDATAQASSRTGGRSVGYLVGVAVAIPLILLLVKLGQKPVTGGGGLRPGLAVVAEVNDLAAPGTRQALQALQVALVTSDRLVVGPSSFPFLEKVAEGVNGGKGAEAGPGEVPPGETPEDVKEAVDRRKTKGRTVDPSHFMLTRRVGFGQADRARWERADALLAEGGYMVPRAVSADRKRAVIRVAPAGGKAFGETEKAALEKVLAAHKANFKGLWAYSQALGIGGEAERAEINRSFGVQIVMIPLQAEEEDHFQKAEVLEAIDAAMAAVARKPGVVSVNTPSSALRYARAVREEQVFGPDVPLKQSEVSELDLALKIAEITQPSSQDGKTSYVEIYTSLEDGKALGVLLNSAIEELQKVRGVTVPGAKPAKTAS